MGPISKNRLLALVGPTATGKTEVAILLAEAINGEIVTADSMQVYRGMDIGTAKPSAEQRARVPHHLLDLLEPDEPFTVAEYQSRADAALADIWSRGKQPILAGGSGLYVRAVLQEMDFARVPPNPELRAKLTEEARTHGLGTLYQRLSECDPAAAARIHPNDEKRIIRALEVAAQISSSSSPSPNLERGQGGEVLREGVRVPRYPHLQFALTLPRTELYQRIEARVETMLAAGLVEEVRALWQRGYDERLTSMKGLGYAQLLSHVRGEVSLAEAIDRLKRDTRRFAKRQLTWFRADPTITWIDVIEIGGLEQAAEFILKEWRKQ